MSKFANRLKEAMHIRGITQSELCAKTNIGKSALSQYLSGKFMPKQQRLHELAIALNVSEPWLMGWDREPDELDKKVLELYPEFVPGKNYISDIIAARQKEEQLRNYLSSVYSDQDMIEDAYEINATMQLYNKDGMKKLRERAEEISELPKYTNNDDDTKNPPT